MQCFDLSLDIYRSGHYFLRPVNQKEENISKVQLFEIHEGKIAKPLFPLQPQVLPLPHELCRPDPLEMISGILQILLQ